MTTPETLLIVEDDPAILFGLRDNFERAGYNVRTAVEGHLGLELARSLRPSLILLDIMLPGIDGYTICQTLRIGRPRDAHHHAHRPRTGRADHQRPQPRCR